MSKLGYKPSLDGLRCVAIGGVIADHNYHHPSSGFLGVDLFFVLSGFLITTLLLEEHQRFGKIALRAFYLRRVLRLAPALVALLTTYACVVVSRSIWQFSAGPSGGQAVWQEFVYGATYTMNLGVIFTQNLPSEMVPLWSLAVEEQYYLVWPVVLIVACALRRTQMLPVSALAAIAAIMAVRWTNAPSHPSVLDAAAVTRFDSILIGCVAAFARWRGLRLPAWSWIPAASLLIPIMFSNTNRIFYDGLSDAYCVAAAILLLSVVESRSVAQRVLSLRPLVLVGRISYGLYLWHLAILIWFMRSGFLSGEGRWIQASAALIVALAAASISYRFVERPFLRMKWRMANVSSHDVSIGAALETQPS